VILLSLSLTLDIPVLDLFKWVPGFAESIKNLFRKLFPRQEKPAPMAAAAAKIPTPILRRAPEAQSDTSAEPSMFPEDTPDLNWVLPHVPDILNIGQDIEPNEEFDQHRAAIIEETLESFGAPGHVVEINRGPTITQFGVEPDFIEVRNQKRRVRVSKITGLADDLALALAARRIRMEAPVPGKGYVGR